MQSRLSQLHEACAACPGYVNFRHFGGVVCSVYQFLHISACAVSANHADKLFDVMTTHAKSWQTTVSVELGSTELINLLGDVVKLMLNQCAEFNIRALKAEVASKGNDVIRLMPKPFMHLLLHAGFLPPAGAEHNFFSLTENSAPFL